MAEKDQPAQESGAAAAQARELRHKKRRKCILYILLFAVFQTAIILLFAITIMRIRTPKFRLTAAELLSVTYSPAAANPSFSIRLNAEFSVKNTNFGRYKFQDGGVSFYYNGALVGSVFIQNSRAGPRSTKRIYEVVDLSSAGLGNRPELGADLSSGVLLLNGRSRLNGEVNVLGLLKRKRSAELDCAVVINLRGRIVGDLSCN